MNPILNTDSYKLSHWKQLPADCYGTYLYAGPRRGLYPMTLWAGFQPILRDTLATPITKEHIDEAAHLLATHGEPFNLNGWIHILRDHNGFMPVRVRAIPEGNLLPPNTPAFTVESTDARVPWVPSYLETALLRAWYPSTVATTSFYIKRVIKRFMEETCDNLDGLPFKLHDFGSRGVSSRQSAGWGGLGHLVNFMGTDTIEALLVARQYYNMHCAGFSIPASEHGTICAWGKEGEVDAYRNMLRQFGQPNTIFACVSDTYDVFNAVENLWGGTLRDEVIRCGATVVIRPDSGDPERTCSHLIDILASKFGYKLNSKGFKVLNSVRLIQGDGVNINTIQGILTIFKAHGFSAENIAFGMGGALLQDMTRDTQGWAMKTSAVFRDKSWVGVSKSPVGDPGKASYAGLVRTIAGPNGFEVTTKYSWEDNKIDAMQTVYMNGRFENQEDLVTIRQRSEKWL